MGTRKHKRIVVCLSDTDEDPTADVFAALVVAPKRPLDANADLEDLVPKRRKVAAAPTRKKPAKAKAPEGYKFAVFANHLPPKPLQRFILDSKTGQILNEI
jgi:hypothetical protein